jgi:glycosyltransferase involved in cell wall biosynthesis
MAEVLRHDESALFFERESAADLTRQVVRLLREPDTARRLGVGARRAERAHFPFSRCVAEYEALYRALVARAEAGTAGSGS